MAETEDACAGCSLQPLELSLVLVCSHRLCLGCAREQLQGALATCPSCGRATSVEAAAAQQIEGFSAPRARNRVDVKRVDLASAGKPTELMEGWLSIHHLTAEPKQPGNAGRMGATGAAKAYTDLAGFNFDRFSRACGASLWSMSTTGRGSEMHTM